jgi:uncharacterized Zn finger protein
VEPTLTELVTREALRSLAGRRSFELGEEYAGLGAVGTLHWDEASVRAGVQGTARYRVRLEAAGGKLVGACSCPVGSDGLFCKHCVAVGLVWLSRGSERHEERAAPTRSELHSDLVNLGADALAGLLVEHALDDERLQARLLALTARSDRKAGPDFRRLAHAFDVAADPGGFVAWNEASDLAAGIDEVVDAVEGHLGGGHGARIVDFCEHALRRLEEAFEYVDDSSGQLGAVKDRLEEVHLAACREARPDPRELADRLFRWELEGQWETFVGAVDRYADILGETGIARYRELAEAAWAGEPELSARDHAWSSRRFRLSQIMEGLARSEGDVDALVAVIARDRSSAYRYLLIAEELLAADRADEATEWAERGVAAFPEQADTRLLDFLCDRYCDAGRYEDAIQLAWRTLEASPIFGAYQRLARVAVRGGVCESWREHAHAVLREVPATGLGARDRSELVAALLWEDDPDHAWHEAKEGCCRPDLWLALARRRERDHPADALEVYRAQIEPAIRHSDNHTYAGAVEWLEKVHAMSVRLGQEDNFDELVQEIRERNRAKRNLIKRLDEQGWAAEAQARRAKGAVRS